MKTPSLERPFSLFPITGLSILAVICLFLIWYITWGPTMYSGPSPGRDNVQTYLIEEVKIDDLKDHFRKLEQYEIPGEYLNSLEVELKKNFPESELWYFDAPVEVWKNLGGSRGYAILKDGKLVYWIEIAVS